MIQRIQTVFLLIVSIASGLMAMLPFSKMTNTNNELLKLYCYGLKNIDHNIFINNTMALFILTLAIGLISLITIFLYQKRILQIRFCVYNILLSIAQFGLVMVYFFAFKKDVGIQYNSFSFTIILPLVNIFLIFQAFRAIRRDDLLIKSYDRLR